MNVKKFLAHSSREALRQVRDALGPDAVILSNRSVAGGVEILALAHDDIASLAAPVVGAGDGRRAAAGSAAPRSNDDSNGSTQAANLAAMLSRAPAPAAPVGQRQRAERSDERNPLDARHAGSAAGRDWPGARCKSASR